MALGFVKTNLEKGNVKCKLNFGGERTYRIRPYGLKGEAWVDETTNGRMRYVPTGGSIRHWLSRQEEQKNQGLSRSRGPGRGRLCGWAEIAAGDP
jgi:hypothetical protein